MKEELIDIIRTLDDIEFDLDQLVECPFCGRLERVDDTYPAAAQILRDGCTRCALESVETWWKEQRCHS